jgi:hypothetical protein
VNSFFEFTGFTECDIGWIVCSFFYCFIHTIFTDDILQWGSISSETFEDFWE